MVRHVLPAAPSLRLEVTEDTCGGIWLHLTYPAPGAGPVPGPCAASGGLLSAADLVLIDSTAHRWGHFGDTRWHTLWALVGPADSAAAADRSGRSGPGQQMPPLLGAAPMLAGDDAIAADPGAVSGAERAADRP